MVNGKQNARLKLRSGEKTGFNSLIVKRHLQSGTVVCLKSFTIYNLPFTIYRFFSGWRQNRCYLRSSCPFY
jgi:hypothetical protein